MSEICQAVILIGFRTNMGFRTAIVRQMGQVGGRALSLSLHCYIGILSAPVRKAILFENQWKLKENDFRFWIFDHQKRSTILACFVQFHQLHGHPDLTLVAAVRNDQFEHRLRWRE